jgi:AraC family transcriptional regulator
VGEETRGGEFAGSVGWTGLRPAGEVHTNRFGPTGAYVLAVIPEPSAHGILPLRWCWSDAPSAYRAGLRFVRHRADPEDSCADHLAELMATLGESGPERRDSARMRVIRARLEDPEAHTSVVALAREAGIHPVVLARQFRAVYGVSPREYRTHAMVRRALQLLVRTKTPISEIAHTCGFADHSHMCRAFRNTLGWSPGLAAR